MPHRPSITRLKNEDNHKWPEPWPRKISYIRFNSQTLEEFQPHKITSVGDCRDFELTEENKQRCKPALGFGSDRRQERSFQVRLEFDGHSWNRARWSGLQVIIVFLRHLFFEFFLPKQALPLSLYSTFNLAFRKTKLPSLSYCDTSFLSRLVSSSLLFSLSPSLPVKQTLKYGASTKVTPHSITGSKKCDVDPYFWRHEMETLLWPCKGY